MSAVLEEMYERRSLMKEADPKGYAEMLEEAAEIEAAETEDKYDEYLHWTEIDWALPGEEE